MRCENYYRKITESTPDHILMILIDQLVYIDQFFLEFIQGGGSLTKEHQTYDEIIISKMAQDFCSGNYAQDNLDIHCTVVNR